MAELLFKPLLRGPISTRVAPTEPNPWAGRTTLNSGSATVVVSTSAVQSDDIFKIAENPGSLGVAANSGGPIVVNSIVQNVSFIFGRSTGVAVPWDTTIMWELLRTSPKMG